MQSLYLSPKSQPSGCRLARILTKHGVSAPSLSRLRYNIVYELKSMRDCKEASVLPLRQAYCSLDGYATKGARVSGLCGRKLLQFLDMATEQYKLNDYQAMSLLKFFKTNISEAWRQLRIDPTESPGRLDIDIDVPWRLQSLSIKEQPGIKQLSNHVCYRVEFDTILVKRHHLWRSVLLQQRLVEAGAGRCLRIQRSHCRGHIVQVGCLLPVEQLPLQVVALYLPNKVRPQLFGFENLMEELEQYLTPLISASKAWEVSIEQTKSTHNINDRTSSIRQSKRFTSLHWYLQQIHLGNIVHTDDGDPITSIAIQTYIYALDEPGNWEANIFKGLHIAARDFI